MNFRAIDYVIDIAEDELTEDIIKQLHFILKHDTKDSTPGWFAVGDYKKTCECSRFFPNGEMKKAGLLIPAWTGRIHSKDLWICWKYSIDYFIF